ncbi:MULTISPECIES: flagellar hook-basal body complex protein [unclassified Pseudomonas]|uniref:flagellar hook-basal body complex protein n=1 Tax=unclassified Pseudomonas TaxID=196821 RepID=UPI002E8111E7|nr:flagellar hook-basal body complex protein [Pseudomonas sp. 10C3]MEE3505293.1 flagellar hook-basal body complex protein [Pseudomonas sp. 10C3]
MSFNVSLSGLHAAHKRLEVAGNNIANVGTHGFKSSRAEFAALYLSAQLGNGHNAVGDGVRLANVSQNFSQGGVDASSGGVLDMRIQGKGFFVVSDNGALSYTRAGAFKMDKNDYIVDNEGNRLQGYGVNAKGDAVNGGRTDLKIDTSNMVPKATTEVLETMNLDSSQSALSALPVFNPDDPGTYSKVISRMVKDKGVDAVAEVRVKDAQGNETVLIQARPAIPPVEHELKQYFVKTDADQWAMYTLIDGRNPVDHTATTPLKVMITKKPDGSLSSAGEGEHIKKTSDTEFTLNGWKPAQQLNGIWAASPASNDGSIVLSLDDGAINGIDEGDVVMARRVPMFDPNDVTTFNKSFATSVYDSLGNKHEMTQYFVKDDTNSWKMHVLVNGRNPANPEKADPVSAQIIFDSYGSVQSMTGSQGLAVANRTLTLEGWVPAKVIDGGTRNEKWVSNGARSSSGGIAIDLNRLSQHNAESARVSAQQDGHAAGNINNISIDMNGVLSAGFTNGLHKKIGQVTLASFANEQGLQPDSHTHWRETNASGIANLDAPKAGTLGSIVSGALEGSNVELTNELVELIQAQVAYQANSKALSTEATLMQTLIQAT